MAWRLTGLARRCCIAAGRGLAGQATLFAVLYALPAQAMFFMGDSGAN